jgi:hypothetical protein
MIIIRWIFLRMKNISDNSCYESQNTFFWKSCSVWGNVENYGRAGGAREHNTIQRMCVACCITKAIDTHSEYI